MKAYFFKVLLTAVAVILCHYAIVLTVRSPIAAEYWIREFIVVKRYQLKSIPSPKIVFAGGSATLFGIDAGEVQRALGRPAFNDGLMAGLRLQDVLAESQRSLQPGDILVLSLEPAYYDYWGTGWSDWQLRNALAWNRSAFDNLPFWKKCQICFEASTTTLSYDLCEARLLRAVAPATLSRREQALEPDNKVVARYLAQKESSPDFAFSIDNLDAHGDILHTEGSHVPVGPLWAPTRPVSIPPDIQSVLIPFLAEMRARQVRVYFDYTPYLVEGTTKDDWEKPAASFEKDLHGLGVEILEPRNHLFFPRELFFNDQLHLNSRGREIRTQALIEALRLKLPAP